MGHGKVKIGERAFSASAVGTLYGCGWNTMLGLYNKYKGIDLPAEPDEQAKESMEFGTFFEDAVARYFAAKMNFKIKKCGETAYWADDMPYFICHPDRLVVGKDEQGRRVALEIKCVSPFSNGWGESGTTEIPDVYYFQVQSYFACQVPCDVVYVVCMRGNRIYSYEIMPDEEVIADIRYRVAKAKADFDSDKVPDSENYDEAVRWHASRVDPFADSIGANDEALAAWNDLLLARADEEEAKAREDWCKKLLVDYMGDSPAIVKTDGKKITKICTWVETTRSSLDRARFMNDHPEINLNDYMNVTASRSVRFNFPRKEA